jgi:hypothetical protein
LLLRQMRRFNPIPNQMAMYGAGHRDIPLLAIIEDPNFRDSEHSYFIQAVDCIVPPLPTPCPECLHEVQRRAELLHSIKADSLPPCESARSGRNSSIVGGLALAISSAMA